MSGSRHATADPNVRTSAEDTTLTYLTARHTVSEDESDWTLMASESEPARGHRLESWLSAIAYIILGPVFTRLAGLTASYTDAQPSLCGPL